MPFPGREPTRSPGQRNQSTIYNVTFTAAGQVTASGSFTTDGASPVDPGYELLTSLTIDQITGFPSGAVRPSWAVGVLPVIRATHLGRHFSAARF